jgi:hypothetical protein
MTLDIIAFDADDTLWHTERNYVTAQNNLATRLADLVDPDTFLPRSSGPTNTLRTSPSITTAFLALSISAT